MCTTRGCREKVRAKGLCRRHYNAAHYRANAENAKARSREWTRRNAEKVKARNDARTPQERRILSRASYQRDPLRGVANAANSKAKRLGVAGRLTADGLRARFAFFAGHCWICRKPGADSIDHVKPLNKGGLNCHSNIRPAHLGCNAARSWEGRK